MVRLGAEVADGIRFVEAIGRRAGFEFWSDEVSYTAIPLGHVVGHRQITDAYIVSVAVRRNGLLAT